MNHLSMAVVIRSGTVLVQERYRKSKGMVFEFPGGSVDSEESGEQAALRELMEETGLTNLTVKGSHTLTNQYGGEIHYVVLEQSILEEPIATEEYRKQIFHWLEPQEIPLQDFYKADIQFIENELWKYV